MIVGDNMRVLPGAQKHLADRGYVADYMTSPIDGMVGKIDSRFVCADQDYLAVDLGFEFPVGIPKESLAPLTPLTDEEESRQANRLRCYATGNYNKPPIASMFREGCRYVLREYVKSDFGIPIRDGDSIEMVVNDTFKPATQLQK